MSTLRARSAAVRLDLCAWLPATEANYPTRKSALFVTLQDFLGIAGQAYLSACRHMEPERGGTWLEDIGDGELLPYAHAKDLHEHLLAELSERLYRHANVTGHFVPPSSRRDLGCRGGAPAVMGHGCPALAAAKPPSAVGPAPAVSAGHATASPADPLLVGLSVQELPVAGPSLPVDIISAEEGGTL